MSISDPVLPLCASLIRIFSNIKNNCHCASCVTLRAYFSSVHWWQLKGKRGDGAEVCYSPATNYLEFSATGNPSLQQHILLHNIWDLWSYTPFSKEPEIKSRVVMVTGTKTTSSVERKKKKGGGDFEGRGASQVQSKPLQCLRLVHIYQQIWVLVRWCGIKVHS